MSERRGPSWSVRAISKPYPHLSTREIEVPAKGGQIGGYPETSELGRSALRRSRVRALVSEIDARRPADEQSPGVKFTVTASAALAKLRLASRPISIKLEDEVLTLSGPAANDAQKEAMELAIKQISNAPRVLNALEVEKACPSANEEFPSTRNPA